MDGGQMRSDETVRLYRRHGDGGGLLSPATQKRSNFGFVCYLPLEYVCFSGWGGIYKCIKNGKLNVKLGILKFGV